ncbi:hypothetical protein BG53_15870 [Paenibacillus darwinianus]|uniref:Uncharacterized protein n=1 Tax=Paenibacillus darwinianus TaxID=1380763 RepID=A0A9W5W7M4_9BACL|nr:hypothetical protein [Paenibacillus darwinianus]EXX89351.1 hypothetical protein BG53_15870 [Paenibacillus darwinianus]EXX90163.1 hypothetical protein BG52_13860 [Paenibacillus darwinianus]EXX91499.1 hypothetical protein CH50_13560 [Paenibacillus darwinianus]
MTSADEKAERRPYFVSVGAGQILSDPTASAYELEINASGEEVNRLQTLFEELASMDEAEVWHYVGHPLEGSDMTDRLTESSGGLVTRIYKLLHELGTERTRTFIEGDMHLTGKGNGR